MQKTFGALVMGLLCVFPWVVGCGDDDEGEAVECCMLKQLASHCDFPNSTVGLQEAVRDWRDIGEKGDADSCKAMINAEENGCSGPSANYDESDAIVDCN